MGSTRDRALDLTRSLTEAESPLTLRPHLQLIASPESRSLTPPWQETEVKKIDTDYFTEQ